MIASGNSHNFNYYTWQYQNGTPENAFYGFYCRGRVKYVVFCAKSSDYEVDPLTDRRPATLPSGIRLYLMERSEYNKQVSQIKSDALTNVKHWTDNFTCESNYTEPRLVVTSLAYDAGWRVYATDVNGERTQLATYKLDGGLVGFVAPAGKTTYRLFFQTKYLKEGILLAMAGFGMYVLFEGIVFLKELKKERQKLGLTIVRRKFDWKNFKAPEETSDQAKPNGP
jgi:hypothetical protein